jgi:two-component system, NtrC family, sensor kinase
LNTDYDKTTGTLNIIPQDIGRVNLNLLNNAFYAVHEKSVAAPTYIGAMADKKFEPIDSISTKNFGDKVLISITDNGNGISQKVMDKIFPAILHYQTRRPGFRSRAISEL